MEFILLVLSIVSITLQAIILRVLLYSKKDNKPKQKIKEEEPISEEYLYSLEFNTKLDGLITPLLGKFNNNDIAKKVYQQLLMKDPKCKKLNNSIIKEYITDILKNYSNSYTEDTLNTIDDVIEELEKHESKYSKDHYQQSANQVNLSNTLNNFYRD